LDFEILPFDREDNLLCLVSFQPLLDFQLLARMPQRRNRRLHLLDVPQIDAALAQLADDDLAQAAQP
jgi:hypothetical protein